MLSTLANKMLENDKDNRVKKYLSEIIKHTQWNWDNFKDKIFSVKLPSKTPL